MTERQAEDTYGCEPVRITILEPTSFALDPDCDNPIWQSHDFPTHPRNGIETPFIHFKTKKSFNSDEIFYEPRNEAIRKLND